MGDQRRGLPVYNFKDALLKTIANNRVTVVEGETGSGKTTQVPQFCLEDAASKGIACNIIIAQPRRISAMSVAERVAAERGETIGKTVGYTIRLESKATPNTRLLFCTTGILLKRLEEDPTLNNVTHVFVDEVHERSIESDFLLMVLRDMLPKRTTDRPLKVVLMSATLDASLFHDYFWGAPSVKFPGRTFPVTELYLEDALEVTGHVVKGNEDWCKKGGSGGQKVVPLEDRDDMELTQQELTARYTQYSSNTQAALSKLDHNAIDYDLVVDTIQWLCNLNTGGDSKIDTTSSAILVFLPGIKEITTLQELLVKSTSSQAAREWILPIHSTIPPEEQRLVFTRPPKGIRKVVLATNIAETAITIDDVAFVVDTGRMKENRYDPLKRMSSLEDCLVARSNARQRRGRAGRVREGVAVHLFTKHRHEKITMAAQAPEVQRVPLEQLVLRIKALQYPGTAAEVCARLVEPPAPQAVERAVEELVFLEAMTISKSSKKEELTTLGVHLSTLPVDCRIGKLILLGAMFGVTDDALTIAATLSYRNPFMSPISAREEADRAKMTFATAQSDHLTVLNAYKQVDAMGKSRYDFCRENFLSIKTIQTIAGLKRQFLELLSAAGFVRPNLRNDENEFEKSLPLLKALLVAALFPQIVIVDDGKSSSGKKGGGGGMTLKARVEDGEKQEEMALHPSCITGKAKGALSSKYLVYHERVKTTRVYIRDATPVSPYALILFGGGRMEVEACPRGSTESVLRLDGWLGFKCPRRDHLLVMELREVLDGILKHKVENPKIDFSEEGAGIIDAV
ncbi:P-loop containing nucleoside triphosphate hydrolase protein, partial [Fragilariopsis cylindrus CCMP1102]